MDKSEIKLLPVHLVYIDKPEDKRKLEQRIGQLTQLDNAFGSYALVLERITERQAQGEKPTDSLEYLSVWAVLMYEGMAIEKGLTELGDKRIPQFPDLSPQAEEDLNLLREQFDRRVAFIKEQKPYLGADDSLVPVAQIAAMYSPQISQGRFRELPQAVGENVRSIIKTVEDSERMDAQLALMSLLRVNTTKFPNQFPGIDTILYQAGNVLEKFLYECWRSLIAEFYHLDGALKHPILSWDEIGDNNAVLVSLLGTYMATRAILPTEVFKTLLTKLIGDGNEGFVDVSGYENNRAQSIDKVDDISQLFPQEPLLQEESVTNKPISTTRRREPTEEERAAEIAARKEGKAKERERRVAEKAEESKSKKPQFPITGIESLSEDLQILIRQWIANTDLLELVTSETVSQRLPDGTVIHFDEIKYEDDGEHITGISFENIIIL